ncbi:mandelate racemase [Ramlibacter albus]|uniref:Mandelate racemase n=1 Tax=Ramlibacter albus TaxID=2079448 RepID=A0A923M9I6_9BURK|nr:mandelate racemase [Ramlibacter albus]MBC5764987.1 mandelate racemase [Ramlibacter albus]
MGTEAPRVRIREIELYERPVKLRLPFRFGVVTLTECPQAFVRARIELPDGRTDWGMAAEMMAPKWFDKNLALSNEDNFEQLRDVLRIARGAYLSDGEPATSYGHFMRHYDACLREGARRGYNPLLAGYGPAQVDRAVFDALCRLLGISFYDSVRANIPGMPIGDFLATLRPARTIAARHTVGLVDAITRDELQTPVNDGLPETLQDVVRTYGHRYFKLKVSGKLEADIERLQKIATVLDRIPEPYHVSLDGNEQYENAAHVAELVEGIVACPQLRRMWESTLFIEQPITRKLALETDIAQADLGKQVIVDESDGEMDSFVVARAHGYAGISSKTCKGFYKSLTNAARCAQWNREEGATRYFMSAEDLTTQAGLSVQQDLALVNLLGITHVERNGHHYVNGMAAQPAHEQHAFLDAHPDLYERSHGAVRLRIEKGQLAIGSLACPGFASAAMPDLQDSAVRQIQ